MLWLVLGALTLFLFLGGLRAFERASVTTIKSLFAWIAALGALAMFGPLIWRQWQAYRIGAGTQRRPGGSTEPPPRRPSGMSVEEAYQVLGLRPGATEADIRAAHHRLMRTAHPDSGGSDWLATRVNQARDVLLHRNHGSA
jgi:DnaJ homolog subfamily C member 19